MNAHLQRASILIEHDRFAEAEPELREALGLEPDNCIAHGLLAICLMSLKRSPEAIVAAHAAIHAAPDHPFGFYAMALVRDDRDELPLAASAIAEAIRLDPECPRYHAVQAGILLQMNEPAEAMQAADRGLALDAENEMCGAYRAMALIGLNRTDDAVAASSNVLQRNPNSALAHAQTGWACLHKDQPAKAREHFREALRIDPDSDWARDGMLEALKTRSPFYRMMLRYFLCMSRLRGIVQWGIILAIWLVGQGLGAIRNASPAAGVVVHVLLGLYVIFLYLTWVAQPLSDATLLFNRDGWMALPKARKRLGMVIGGGTAAAVTSFLWAQWSPHRDLLYLLGATTLVLCIIASAAFSTGWTKKPAWLTLMGVGLMVITLLSLLLILGGTPGGWAAAMAALVGVGAYMIICNVVASRII